MCGFQGRVCVRRSFERLAGRTDRGIRRACRESFISQRIFWHFVIPSRSSGIGTTMNGSGCFGEGRAVLIYDAPKDVETKAIGGSTLLTLTTADRICKKHDRPVTMPMPGTRTCGTGSAPKVTAVVSLAFLASQWRLNAVSMPCQRQIEMSYFGPVGTLIGSTPFPSVSIV